jgi:hypothetical protein
MKNYMVSVLSVGVFSMAKEDVQSHSQRNRIMMRVLRHGVRGCGLRNCREALK